MSPDIIIALVAALFAILTAIIVNTLYKFLMGLLPRTRKGEYPITYRNKMSKLTKQLNKAADEMDRVLEEMHKVSNQRESTIKELENQLTILTGREKHLKEKIQTLKQVPIPAIEHFTRIIEKGEKRKAYRDYVLFGLGALLSTVITIALKAFGF